MCSFPTTADHVHFVLQLIQKIKFLPTYIMMNLRVACPSKAISLPGQKQVKKQRQEIILGVVRQSLKQKAIKTGFISGVQFRAILQ